MGYSKKKQIGGWGHTFLKPHWKFSFIYFTPGNSRQINAPPLEIVQNCIKSLGSSKTKNQDHLEIPHNFFLVTPGNSTCYFFDTPGNSISNILNTPPSVFFFWNNPMWRGCVFFFSFDLDRYFILSVKNRSGRWGAVANGQNPLKVICYIYTEEYFGWLATKPSVQQLVAS